MLGQVTDLEDMDIFLGQLGQKGAVVGGVAFLHRLMLTDVYFLDLVDGGEASQVK